MDLEEMKQLVHRHDQDVINRKDLSVLTRDLTADFVDHAAPPGAPQGREGAKVWLSLVHSAFPDIQATITDTVAEGDRVVVRKSWSGTHEGPFQGVEPTGRSVKFEGIVIWRIQGGKLAERWAAIDRLTIFREFGVLPPGFSEGSP